MRPATIRSATMRVAMAGPVVLLLLLAGAGQIRAATIRIDFEEYKDGYNLNGINLGGVTLKNPSGRIEIYENRFGVSYHSANKAIASLSGLESVNPLIGIFDDPVSYVSLWGGDAGTHPELDSWELWAYDARSGGRRVGRVKSGTWDGSPYRRLDISAPEIWRFEARWTGPQFGIGFDDLKFVTIPPAAKPERDPDPDPDPESPPPTIEPSNASFKGSEDANEIYIDFGEVSRDSTAPTKFFDLWNYVSTEPAATLALDGIAGDTDVLSTNLETFDPLAPNSWQSFMASLDPSTPGEISGSIELTFSDSTGAPQSPLTINFTGYVVPEPSSFVLAAVGLLSLLGWGRHRRKAV